MGDWDFGYQHGTRTQDTAGPGGQKGCGFREALARGSAKPLPQCPGHAIAWEPGAGGVLDAKARRMGE